MRLLCAPIAGGGLRQKGGGSYNAPSRDGGAEEAHSVMAYEAKKSDKFTFGRWTLGNPGRDPFGEPVRKGFTPVEMVRELSKLGAYGVNFHDNDLVPFGSSAAERDRIVREFKNALEENGMVVPMATTNLFGHPVFKDGAFTSNNAE